jgi:hypothetical protein
VAAVDGVLASPDFESPDFESSDLDSDLDSAALDSDGLPPPDFSDSIAFLRDSDG